MRYWRIGLLLLVALIARISLAPAFADAPRGTGPGDPLMVTGNWQTIAPNASLWFYFDYSGYRSNIMAELDANGTPNLSLAVFTPQQANAWTQDPETKPVGWGTRQNPASAEAVHDLVWSGAFNFRGRFFAVVTNNNPTLVSFRLMVRGNDVALAPTPTRTRRPTLVNPYATVVPTGTIAGRLLFRDASGGIIYSVNGDGTNLVRVSQGLDPSWSPDEKQIAFTRWEPQPAGLYIANADGTNERQIFAGEKVMSPQWSPNGTYLAFTRLPAAPEYKQACFYIFYCFVMPTNNPVWKLGVVDVNSGKLFDPRSSRYPFSPTWSTDNQTVAYADANFGILKTDIKSSAEHLVFGQNAAVQSTRWSPDGSQIAFQIKQHDHWEINVMDADGSDVRAVTRRDPLAVEVVNNVAPTWAPDGKQILFLSDLHGKWEFFVADTDGTNMRHVLKNVTDAITIQYDFCNERVIDWAQ